MERQRDLLRETDWNVLLILDACRSEAFEMVTDVDARPVRSMAWCTRHWMPRFAQVLDGEPVLYVSANPVCERELLVKRTNPNFSWRSLWRDNWDRYGPHEMPTVHPEVAAAEVARYLRAHGQPARMVVHFIQPHLPFIGEGALPYADWGRVQACPFAAELHRAKHPQRALAQGKVTRAELRQAYLGNLRLVWRTVLRLVELPLHGRVVVTADHGELIGENGRYGHRHGACPELLTVPWFEPRWRARLDPQPIADVGPADAEDDAMLDRLKDLGYV